MKSLFHIIQPIKIYILWAMGESLPDPVPTQFYTLFHPVLIPLTSLWNSTSDFVCQRPNLKSFMGRVLYSKELIPVEELIPPWNWFLGGIDSLIRNWRFSILGHHLLGGGKDTPISLHISAWCLFVNSLFYRIICPTTPCLIISYN